MMDRVRQSPLLPLVAVVAVLLACGSSDSEGSSSPSNVVMTGEEAVVRWSMPGGDPFWLAADEEALDLMTEAAVARDEVGMGQLALAGRIYSVPVGTRVLVLDPGFLQTKVRVLEGEHTGRVGWQAREFVVPAPQP